MSIDIHTTYNKVAYLKHALYGCELARVWSVVGYGTGTKQKKTVSAKYNK